MWMNKIEWHRGFVPIAGYDNNQILGYKNGHLCKMDQNGQISNICDFSNSVVDYIKESNRLLSRLFRRDIKTVCALQSGEVYFFKNKILYRYVEKSSALEKIYILEKEMSTPLNLVPAIEDTDYQVLWGDYFANSGRKEVIIWGLIDEKIVTPVYKFPAGSVRHIHNIIPDKKRKGYYIFTGDNEPAAGIYYADASFNCVEPILVGSQLARAVQGFSVEEGIIYATDSVKEQNYICKLEKKDECEWQQNIIFPINGSCIYATQMGEKMLFSTTVESSEVDDGNRLVALLSTKRGAGIITDNVEIVSMDSNYNSRIEARFKKDAWPYKLFQYGAVVFPPSKSNKVLIYPIAVKKYDGKLGIMSLREEVSNE